MIGYSNDTGAPSATLAGTAWSAIKVCFAGTHRVRTPEETLERIEPIFRLLGITRLADVTWLDDVGVPVFQAVRPDSRMLCVSQGKGLTRALAKVSAAMESIEMWHAERIPPGARVATLGDVSSEIDYELSELGLRARHCLNEHTKLEWSVARRLGSSRITLVPTAFIRLDARVSPRWAPPIFHSTTNGLASGNTFDEAALHGLYELIERDALVQAAATNERYRISAETVDGASGSVLEHFARAGVEVFMEVLPSRFRVPCFRARIWSDAFPTPFAGFGCHRDRDVALCRALTEAAQSRVTAIAGTRDDLLRSQYQRRRWSTVRPDLEQADTKTARPFDEVESTTAVDLDEDLRAITARVKEVLGRDVLVVEHTRHDVGVPVVHVICPGMRFDKDLQ